MFLLLSHLHFEDPVFTWIIEKSCCLTYSKGNCVLQRFWPDPPRGSGRKRVKRQGREAPVASVLKSGLNKFRERGNRVFSKN